MPRARRTWRVSEHSLKAMTPELARALLIECFVEARVEAESGSRTSWPADKTHLRNNATRVVKAAFKELGYDFMHPDAASCRMVLEQLSRDSRLHGTPSDIVEHHVVEYGRVIEALERAAAAE